VLALLLVEPVEVGWRLDRKDMVDFFLTKPKRPLPRSLSLLPPVLGLKLDAVSLRTRVAAGVTGADADAGGSTEFRFPLGAAAIALLFRNASTWTDRRLRAVSRDVWLDFAGLRPKMRENNPPFSPPPPDGVFGPG